MEWEIALVTCKEQVLTVTRERDAVLAYATDLERQVKHVRSCVRLGLAWHRSSPVVALVPL